MATHTSAVTESNLLGALLFILHASFAIIIPIFTGFKLLKHYLALGPKYLSQRRGRASTSTHLQIFLALSLISSSLLARHILGFCIQLYEDWTTRNRLEFAQSVYGDRGIVGRDGFVTSVWHWLTSSTMFLDFAQELCGSWERYWWTSQALWATMGVNVFIGLYGRRGDSLK